MREAEKVVAVAAIPHFVPVVVGVFAVHARIVVRIVVLLWLRVLWLMMLLFHVAVFIAMAIFLVRRRMVLTVVRRF